MNCLVVDDEILAQDVLEHYIQKTSGLQLAGKCSNALEAIAALNKGEIDLMFLDIKMPEISGIDLIKLLKEPPSIVLTTAFPDYALQGYELDVADYLLKPVAYERFLKAVQKVRALQKKTASENALETKSIFIKNGSKLIQVHPSDLIYIEGLKNYLVLYTQNNKIIVHSTFQNMETELRSYDSFLRIHKSYLVNKQFIGHIHKDILQLTTGTELPIGAVYKRNLLASLNIIN